MYELIAKTKRWGSTGTNYQLIPKTNKKLKMGMKRAIIVKQTNKVLENMCKVLVIPYRRHPNKEILVSKLLKCSYSNLIKALEGEK